MVSKLGTLDNGWHTFLDLEQRQFWAPINFNVFGYFKPINWSVFCEGVYLHHMGLQIGKLRDRFKSLTF